MKNLRQHKVFFILFLTIIVNSKLTAQTTISTSKDQILFDQLLEKKMAMNNQFSLYTNYSIQLKNSNKDEAEKIYKEFTDNYPEIDATIIFSNPKFKVVVGNFKNKIEAENLLTKLKQKYEDAFVVKLKQ